MSILGGINATKLAEVEKRLRQIEEFAKANEEGCNRNGMSQAMYWEGKRIAIAEVLTLLNLK